MGGPSTGQPGTDSRALSVQAGRLGWRPVYTDVEEFYRYVQGETERIGKLGRPYWTP